METLFALWDSLSCFWDASTLTSADVKVQSTREACCQSGTIHSRPSFVQGPGCNRVGRDLLCRVGEAALDL